MQSPIRAWLDLGATVDQPHAEQRRVTTINVVALIAFSATVVFAVVFFPSRPPEVPVWFYAGLSAAYLAGYAASLGLNRLGRHDAAVIVLLTTGLGNIAGASLTVGFSTGPAVFMVSVAIGAAFLTRAEQPTIRWLFVGLAIVAYGVLAVFDPPAAPAIAGSGIESLLVAASYGGMVVFVVTVVWYQRRLADRAEDALTRANELSERLLLNILPSEIAERLKSDEYPIADRKSDVTVLFADIVGSTEIADRLSADDLVRTLDVLFSSFDDIADEHGLDKIKTVGDSYLAVAGLTPSGHKTTESAADAALSMRDETARHHFPGFGQVRMRFGLHTGPVVAGVIGKRKFSYDVWGDTVNTASRMESTGEADMIQVSEQVRDLLDGDYEFRGRGEISIKGKGTLPTHQLIARRTPSDPAAGS